MNLCRFIIEINDDDNDNNIIYPIYTVRNYLNDLTFYYLLGVLCSFLIIKKDLHLLPIYLVGSLRLICIQQ